MTDAARVAKACGLDSCFYSSRVKASKDVTRWVQHARNIIDRGLAYVVFPGVRQSVDPNGLSSEV